MLLLKIVGYSIKFNFFITDKERWRDNSATKQRQCTPRRAANNLSRSRSGDKNTALIKPTTRTCLINMKVKSRPNLWRVDWSPAMSAGFTSVVIYLGPGYNRDVKKLTICWKLWALMTVECFNGWNHNYELPRADLLISSKPVDSALAHSNA